MKKNCHVPMCFVHITNNTLGGYLCVTFTMFNSLHPMHTKDFFFNLKKIKFIAVL